MGQCFEWVNFTKEQYLGDEPFPYGLKYTETCFTGCLKTDAVCTLLAREWQGDLVLFAGEYMYDLGHMAIPEDWSGLRAVTELAVDYYDIDYEFEDVAGRFSYSRGKDGWRPRMVDGLETMVKVPYDGPFDLDIIHYRYIVNKTKNVYYDREAMPKRGVTSRFDPLPMLMGSALGGLLVDGKPVPSFDGKKGGPPLPTGRGSETSSYRRTRCHRGSTRMCREDTRSGYGHSCCEST